MNQTIEVVISPTGESRIETKGFAGSACQQASRFLELLGIKTSEKLTADYHLAAVAQQQLSGPSRGSS